jgi:hypothetical protein
MARVLYYHLGFFCVYFCVVLFCVLYVGLKGDKYIGVLGFLTATRIISSTMGCVRVI